MSFILTALGVYALLVVACYAARWLSEEDKRAQKSRASRIGIGDFMRFVFPMIRKTYPSLIAHDLVTVQPMTGPVSEKFYKAYYRGRPQQGPYVPKWKRDEVSKQISKVEQQICNAWEI